MIVMARIGDLIPPNVLIGLEQAIKTQWLESVGAVARDQWVKIAGERLSGSRRDYLAAIQEVEAGEGSVSIALVGEVANIIERGQDAYDMHDTLLGPKVPVVARGAGRGKHQRKNGKGFYRAIPFRHATPGTTGAVGAAMGSAYRNHWLVHNSRELGKAIYDKAKRLKPTTGMPGEKVKWGGRLPSGLAPKLKSRHHSDIYAGMVKSSKTYQQATQSQYTTFRTISTGSPGWMRPAVPGKKFADDVSAYVRSNAQHSLNQFLLEAEKGAKK